ncbi:MAG: Gldg family protein, partial [Anaerolineae bacterium]
MVAQLRDRAPQLAMVGIVALAIGAAAQMLGSDPVWLPQLFWGIGAVLILSYGLLRPAELRAALTGRQARYGGNALVASLAFVGILAFINYLGAQYHRRFDLTETGQYSLSQQTKQILAGLTEPVQVTAFMAPGDQRAERVQNLLDEYKYLSDNVDYRFIDPDRQPALARQYGITSYGQLVFEQGDRKQETFGLDEQDITSAILKVSETEPRKVYFTTGHRERSPEETGANGYSVVRDALKRDNYEVEMLNLQTITDTFPSDAGAIIVAGPQVAFAAEEAQR